MSVLYEIDHVKHCRTFRDGKGKPERLMVVLPLAGHKRPVSIPMSKVHPESTCLLPQSVGVLIVPLGYAKAREWVKREKTPESLPLLAGLGKEAT